MGGLWASDPWEVAADLVPDQVGAWEQGTGSVY